MCVLRSSNTILKDSEYLMKAKCFHLFPEPCTSPDISRPIQMLVMLDLPCIVVPVRNELLPASLFPGKELVVADPYHLPQHDTRLDRVRLSDPISASNRPQDAHPAAAESVSGPGPIAVPLRRILHKNYFDLVQSVAKPITRFVDSWLQLLFSQYSYFHIKPNTNFSTSMCRPMNRFIIATMLESTV
jgi:hypothetical protein